MAILYTYVCKYVHVHIQTDIYIGICVKLVWHPRHTHVCMYMNANVYYLHAYICTYLYILGKHEYITWQLCGQLWSIGRPAARFHIIDATAAVAIVPDLETKEHWYIIASERVAALLCGIHVRPESTQWERQWADGAGAQRYKEYGKCLVFRLVLHWHLCAGLFPRIDCNSMQRVSSFQFHFKQGCCTRMKSVLFTELASWGFICIALAALVNVIICLHREFY